MARNPKVVPSKKHQPQEIDNNVLLEANYYPFRHFPQLRQSIRAASANGSARPSKPLLPELPVMEHKVHSFARKQSPTLHEIRPKSASAANTGNKPQYKHNEEKIFSIQQKMTRLQRTSCLDDIYGLQHVRRVILKESNKLRKELLDISDPRRTANER